MWIENIRIENLDQARNYYVAMGCSHFHLSRENFERRDEYYALKVPKLLEEKWRMEEFLKRIDSFKSIETDQIGLSFLTMDNLVGNYDFYHEQMLQLADSFKDKLTPEQAQFIINAIIGTNRCKSHGGLIERVSRLNRRDLLLGYQNCVKYFLWMADKHELFIPYVRGYFVDVIEYYKLKESSEYIKQLRQKDEAQNFRQIESEVNKGNVYSMTILAKYYKEGRGCKKNKKQTRLWLSKAIAEGSDIARKELWNLNNPVKYHIQNSVSICAQFLKDQILKLRIFLKLVTVLDLNDRSKTYDFSK